MKCPECGEKMELMPDGEWVCKHCGYYFWEEDEDINDLWIGLSSEV
jgi:transcription initiation factor TFIIIB Brf1 subunit/transcription initiation factor TFIIB